MDDLFKSLDIYKGEWLEDIERGDSLSASFLACVEECISERESRRFEEGLNTKVKLYIYKRFGKSVEFKKYLHGVCDAGSRLLFKFRSGTHGLNEELGRHRGREGKTECSLCGNECENVSHVLCECSAYSSTRACFIKKLQELLKDGYVDLKLLDNVEKLSYVLGSELWESKFDGLLSLVKVTGYVLLINIHDNKKPFISTNSYTSLVYSQPNDSRKNTSRRASSYLFISFNTDNIQGDKGQ